MKVLCEHSELPRKGRVVDLKASKQAPVTKKHVKARISQDCTSINSVDIISSMHSTMQASILIPIHFWLKWRVLKQLFLLPVGKFNSESG